MYSQVLHLVLVQVVQVQVVHNDHAGYFLKFNASNFAEEFGTIKFIVVVDIR